MLFTRLLQHVPGQCAVCRGWGDAAVCSSCHLRYAAPTPRCGRCALKVPPGVQVCGACRVDPPPFDAACAAVDYGHPWSALITQFKFQGALELASSLSALMHRALERHDAPDLILPVPLSPERLRERGYNQAWELARRVARALGRPADAHLLLRMRHSPHQLALEPERRAANVHNAFAVEPLRRAELTGRHVAVLDDVMTTGATLAEIARVLKQAGAGTVQVWAVARTPRPADGP